MANFYGNDPAIQIKLKDFNAILAWFKEHSPSCEESFYQVDDVELSLPELGIAVFNLLVKNNLYKPE